MQRKNFSAEFKGKVALEAIKDQKTVNEIASENGIFPNQVIKWKKELVDRISELYSENKSKEIKQNEELVPHLYQQIGQLKVEVDWLKKKSGIKSWG